MTLPKSLWSSVGALSMLVVAVSASAQAIEWADVMKATERALNESRYDDAEQYLRTALRYAEKSSRAIGGSIEPSALWPRSFTHAASTGELNARVSMP